MYCICITWSLRNEHMWCADTNCCWLGMEYSYTYIHQLYMLWKQPLNCSEVTTCSTGKQNVVGRDLLLKLIIHAYIDKDLQHPNIWAKLASITRSRWSSTLLEYMVASTHSSMRILAEPKQNYAWVPNSNGEITNSRIRTIWKHEINVPTISPACHRSSKTNQNEGGPWD